MLSMDDLRYTADLPYPPIKVEMKNPAYAKAMLDNIGGLNSEMSAISLYVYNNLILEEKKEIAAIFHKVSIVEMHHLEIFGKLALQLGEDPRMWTHYGCKNQHQIAYIRDENITEILRRIILDERLHVEIFEQVYRTYC